MPSTKPFRSLAEQISELDDPAPRDVDIEDFEGGFARREDSSEDSNGSVDEDAGREHYEEVGASQIRRANMPALGSQYAGARVSRGAATNGEAETDEGSSDEEFAEGDEADGGEGEELSSWEDESGSEAGDSANEEAESQASSMSNPDQSDGDEDEDEDGKAMPRLVRPQGLSAADRAAMREMMAAEQKAVASSISQAAQDDIAKGQAVRKQRDVYTSHLHARIRLQKGLIEANSLKRVLAQDAQAAASHDALQAAEEAALKLLRTISELRTSFSSDSNSDAEAEAAARRKRTFSAAFPSSSEIQQTLQAAHDATLPHHRSVLSKWASKTQSASIRPSHDKLGGVVTTQSLLGALDGQLGGSAMERALTQAQTARACAPLHVAAGIERDADIYDDGGFYALLLREFIEARSAAAGSGSGVPQTLDVDVASLRHANRARRKDVDVKASKGRKMRYTVHEKLQNFMAPQPVGSWSERQADELFASLFGKKVRGGLGEAVHDDDNAENEEDKEQDVDAAVGAEMEGLRLFRSSAAA